VNHTLEHSTGPLLSLSAQKGSLSQGPSLELQKIKRGEKEHTMGSIMGFFLFLII